MTSVSIAVREDAMAPFDRWLATALEERLGRPVPRSLCRKAIAGGFVAVAGRIERDPGHRLSRGRSVFVHSLSWLPETRATERPGVLFEDAWLLALDKPAGLATHETADLSRPTLTAFAERHAGHRVFVHHRLDAETSGCVLFAKKAEANPGLARAFAGREVAKTYIAVVDAPATEWPTDFVIDTPIIVSANGRVSAGPGGEAARTRVRVLRRGQRSLLVEAQPVTGRKHQIRAHLASMGAPVCGDARYGGSKARRLLLHARELVLAHPVTGRALRISSPLPPGFEVDERAMSTGRSRPRAEAEGPDRRRPASRSSDAPRPKTAGRTEAPPRMRGRATGRGSHR